MIEARIPRPLIQQTIEAQRKLGEIRRNIRLDRLGAINASVITLSTAIQEKEWAIARAEAAVAKWQPTPTEVKTLAAMRQDLSGLRAKLAKVSAELEANSEVIAALEQGN